jgi:hypothetical protein
MKAGRQEKGQAYGYVFILRTRKLRSIRAVPGAAGMGGLDLGVRSWSEGDARSGKGHFGTVDPGEFG